jgi:hypothetical protein
MDFAKAFAFVFDDPDWIKKIVIGGLVTLIPVVGSLLALGYMVSIGRNVIQGNPHPLPDWSAFGQMLIDGLYALVIYFVYTLPILIVLCLVLLPSLVIGGAFGEDGSLNVVAILGICCFSLFAIIYGIAVGVLFLPVALARYADTGDMMSALRFTQVLAISRANLVVFLMALVIAWVAGIVAGFGVILCFVGVVFTGFYAQCVIGHAYGQAYLLARQRAG